MLSDPAFASQIAHLVISLPPLGLNYVAGTRSLLLPKHLHLQLRGIEGDSFGGFGVDLKALRDVGLLRGSVGTQDSWMVVIPTHTAARLRETATGAA